MNRLLFLPALAAAALLFLAAAPDTPPAPIAPVDLRVDISPTVYGPYELLLREQHPDTYTCSATLIDAPKRRIYSRVQVVVRPGQELTKTMSSPELTMTLKGKVDAARKGAVADVSVFRDGQLIAHQESRVFLADGRRAQIY
ncbi:MAG TPA: hypothetical protein VNN08_13385 [Thermoanaerobaculia bacterium]|nr:hypothetical protein [Thermoanaerobaculia bacterium]